MIKSRFLSNPDAIVNLGINAAANRAVRTHRADGLSTFAARWNRGLRFANHAR